MPRQPELATKPLTPRQARFVQEFMIDLNATQAAIRAGYSMRRSEVTGTELVGNRRVAAAIAERQAKMAAKLEISAERVLQEYARIAFADMRRFVTLGPGVTVRPSSAWSDHDAAVVAEVSETTTKDGGAVRFKLHSKTAALDALSKHLGLFPVPNTEVTVDNRTLYASDSLIAAILKAREDGRLAARTIEGDPEKLSDSR